MSVLFKITYGLYLLSTEFEGKSNGCIINTVMQQSSSPEKISITVNKQNYTHDMIMQSKRCVVNILDTNAKFEFFQNFGMQSGRNVDKFVGIETIEVGGIKTNSVNTGGNFLLSITETYDMGTHTMFVGEIVESTFTNSESLTYAYYHKNIKPKPQPKVESNAEVWVCAICNYEHTGTMPEDFICPICKHGAKDFIKV